ncbi:hypothetical protein [Bradyrhizobium sp. 23]|uniref:hypothetical protein n=1 Tax=Bradyrhizobium sp. 23 TaxID=2782667 RepID=UPI001FF9D856|nr:hypothetical protein [Bradyrhizobium sp. 23]MCK1316639.1 hypothetical protein [Bradyrhizobium sp. 23]
MIKKADMKGWTPKKHLQGWTPEHGWAPKNGNVPQKAKRNVSIDKGDPIIVGVHSTAPRPASDPQDTVTIERLDRALALCA